MNVRYGNDDADRERWEAFVEAHPAATKFHLWNWRNVIRHSFGWRTFYLMATEGTSVRGIFPLAWKRSRLFGSFVSSLPALNGGGILADDRITESLLLEEAKRLTRELKADYLELRNREDRGLHLSCSSDRVSVLVPIDSDPDKMWRRLSSKTRTSVRKSLQSGFTAEYGGEELLDDFYSTFAENMRDLGAPVYGRSFFLEILRAFPRRIEICVVRWKGQSVAAAFLNTYREVIESQWAASIRPSLPLKPNMFLHWNVLCHAAERGLRMFDFGRSWVDSGTYLYKMRWGGQAVPLHWNYWYPQGRSVKGVTRQDPKFQPFIRVWKRLPLPLATMLGSQLVRYLPS